jgi:hypothetical protein
MPIMKEPKAIDTPTLSMARRPQRRSDDDQGKRFEAELRAAT